MYYDNINSNEDVLMKANLYNLLTKKEMSLRDMGEKLGMSRQRVASLVSKLEKRGYVNVKRARSPYIGGNYLQNVYTGNLFK